jgi:glutamate/tyrosine decarboxylase-like PLP-dependent enzyme
VDPLPAIAKICRDFDLWFHVDGAYGALAAQVPDAPGSLGAISLADSVAVDPHKWLYAPLEAGCVLVRNPQFLRDAFSYQTTYYHFDDRELNYFEYGPQNSRGFRALKVWLGLRQAGRAGCLRMIADDMALSRRLYSSLSAHPAFEAFTQSLSITTFRYVPEDLQRGVGTGDTEAYLDALNRDLLTRVEKSGQAFLSNALVGERFALRACIVNFRTSEADVDALPELLGRLGREADGEMRKLTARRRSAE